MKKFYYKVFVLALIFFIIYSFKVFPQDSVKVNSFEDSPVKKGSWAIVFELGTLLRGNSNSSPESIEGYHLLLKYQISKISAIRFNLGFNGVSDKEVLFDSYDNKSYNIQSSINIQIFISQKYFAKPFLSIGPYFNQNYTKYRVSNNVYNNYNFWDIGLMSTIGAEVFIYKSVGIIGEYILKATIGKRYTINTDEYEGESDYNRNKVRANTTRFGVSFYF